jgi:hypothetical protein
MSEFLDLLLRISPSPLLVLVLLIAGWFVLSPAQAVVGRVEAALERSISLYKNSNIFNRMTIFVIALSFAIGLFASLWCYFLTDLPPPAVDPNFQHPLGPFITRLHGYLMIWVCCMMPFFGYILGAGLNTERPDGVDVLGKAARQLPFAVLLALVPSCLWIGHAAFVDATVAYKFPLPALDADVLLWWYSWVPLMSVGWGIFAYLVYLLFRWLWKLTAHIA